MNKNKQIEYSKKGGESKRIFIHKFMQRQEFSVSAKK
jgi:hypothetical protein